jgi:hypothetical protein
MARLSAVRLRLCEAYPISASFTSHCGSGNQHPPRRCEEQLRHDPDDQPKERKRSTSCVAGISLQRQRRHDARQVVRFQIAELASETVTSNSVGWELWDFDSELPSVRRPTSEKS